MAQFASEKIAVGDCDRCGITYPLKKLKFLTIRMKRTNIRVCPDCYEADHPQYKLGTFKITDPQALKNPRPADNSDRALWQMVWRNGRLVSLPTVADAGVLNGYSLNTQILG